MGPSDHWLQKYNEVACGVSEGKELEAWALTSNDAVLRAVPTSLSPLWLS